MTNKIKPYNDNPPEPAIDLKQVIYSLSDALDFVGIDEIHHGKRVGLMAMECAVLLGMNEAEIQFVFETGLLHDCGVSSTRIHNHLITEFDWANSQAHCDTGYELLNNVEMFSPMALPVKYHHTHWKTLKDLNINDKIKNIANLIYLADRVDVLAAPHYGRDILAARKKIQNDLTSKSGEFFSPEIYKAFWEAAEKQSFWLSLSPEHILNYISEIKQKPLKTAVSPGALYDIARMFAQIVDAKSTFTMEHSMGVAKLARLLAEKLKLGRETEYKIEIAGLLHDLGKLKIPDELLEKKAPLDENERGIIQEHSFETYEILSKITGIEDVARWAAYHHERPDGKGYPFHISGKNLETEARIITASDIFQALVQNRPYRSALSIQEAISIMQEMAKEGSLDPDIVGLIEDSAIDCYRAATSL